MFDPPTLYACVRERIHIQKQHLLLHTAGNKAPCDVVSQSLQKQKISEMFATQQAYGVQFNTVLQLLQQH
jgi:hypothetical protein